MCKWRLFRDYDDYRLARECRGCWSALMSLKAKPIVNAIMKQPHTFVRSGS